MADGGGYEKRRRSKRGYAYRAYLNREGELREPNLKLEMSQGTHCCNCRGKSKWTMNVCGDVESLELATTARERMRGMLFRSPDEVTRILVPCHDIHTFGMRYPLDVAFISRDGEVLKVHRNVSTMQRIRHKGASLVAERFSRSGDWLMEGDVIRIGQTKRE